MSGQIRVRPTPVPSARPCLVNLAIDSKLRGCDLVRLQIDDGNATRLPAGAARTDFASGVPEVHRRRSKPDPIRVSHTGAHEVESPRYMKVMFDEEALEDLQNIFARV